MGRLPHQRCAAIQFSTIHTGRPLDEPSVLGLVLNDIYETQYTVHSPLM